MDRGEDISSLGAPGQPGPAPPSPEGGVKPKAESPSDAVRNKHRLSSQPGGRTNVPAGVAPQQRNSLPPHPVSGIARVSRGVHADEGLEPLQLNCDEDAQLNAAARMMQAIEDEVEQIRRGAGRVIAFQPASVPQRASVGVRGTLARLTARARRLAEEKPLQTLAALCGLGFAFGAAIRRRTAARK